MSKMNPSTPFTDKGKSLNFTILDFWQYQYSNVFDLQEYIAEFLVGKALGLVHSMNTDGWTLFDMEYKGKRVEVKETAYFHSWQDKFHNGKISKQRTFDIHQAHVRYKDSSSDLARNSDIYIFCLNTGNTPEDANPMQMEHWEFYVVPTSLINEKCGSNKTISLGKVRSLASPCSFSELKDEVDILCQEDSPL